MDVGDTSREQLLLCFWVVCTFVNRLFTRVSSGGGSGSDSGGTRAAAHGEELVCEERGACVGRSCPPRGSPRGKRVQPEGGGRGHNRAPAEGKAVVVSTSGDRHRAALTAFSFSSDYIPAKVISDHFTPGQHSPLVAPKPQSCFLQDLVSLIFTSSQTPAKGQHLQQLLLLFHTSLDHASCPSRSLSSPG